MSWPNTHFIFDGVSGVLLLFALLVWSADVQVLHVCGQHLRNPNAGKDAHHRGQHQHQTHLREQQDSQHLSERKAGQKAE